MTLDASNVPVVITITNTNVVAENTELENEGKINFQLFRTNFKVELAAGDVVKLKVANSDELLYYLLLNNKEGITVATAE